MQWSSHQNRVFEFVARGSGSGVVIAVAGSGKTTTIVEAVHRIDPRFSVHMLAFNSSIAKELKDRVPGHVRTSTFHSVGYGAIRKKLNANVTVDSKKMKKLLEKNLSLEDLEIYGSFVEKLVSFAKGEGVGALSRDTYTTWMGIVDHHDMFLDVEMPDIQPGEDVDDYMEKMRTFEEDAVKRAIEIAQKAMKWSEEDAEKGTIDFDDQLYLPLKWNLSLFRNDFVFIDELQDASPVRRALARKMLKTNGRIIGVGDPKQSIYGFTGATVDSMELFAAEHKATEMYLSVSYRCARSVVALAKNIVPYIESAPSAPEGEVVYNAELLSRTGASFDPTTLTNRDAILCRNTAPLISYAFKLIAKRIPCRVLGREIGQNLVSLVKKMKATTLENLEEKLLTYQSRETDKLRAKGEEQKAEAIADKVQCLLTIVDSLSEDDRSVQGVIDSIESLFSDDDRRQILTLSTCHKAKGKEWETVVIINPELMPSKMARQPWQKEQETNLMYVAYTRAKKRLIIMN